MAKHAQTKLTGAIPRIERQQSHHEFLWAVRPPIVMVGITHAARIAMHDDTFFPPETHVVITSTISDSELSTYTFEDELRIIREINPKWVIPFDFPVYGDMDADRRMRHVEQVANGIQDMQYILGDLTSQEIERVAEIKDLPKELVAPQQDTTVIPLIKGVVPNERRKIINTGESMNAPVYAKYGAQYMTVGGNGSHPELCRDLESIQSETNNHPVLVIGLLSPSGRYSLESVPDNVTAAAGMNQWIKQINPKSNSASEMREAFESLYNGVSDTLNADVTYYADIAGGTSDEPPSELTTKRGIAVGDDLSASISGAAGDEEYGFGQRKRSENAMTAVEAGRKGGKTSPKNNE
jgi:hypothetical protein